MKEQDRKIIESLQKFPSDSAGGIMTTEYIALNENLTMAQALAKIKEIVEVVNQAGHNDSVSY